MYNLDNIQYVFRQSNGVVWNFFFDARVGLSYSILGKKNIWSDTISLQKNIYPGFYVDIDLNDKFHVVFQDKHGDIFYSLISNGEISTFPILKSKLPSVYNKNLKLLNIKNNIHFFYILKNDTSIILAHQELKRGVAGNPKVIDYVSDGESPYSVVYDGNGSIFVFYQSSDGKHMQLGYKRYVVSKEQWSEFTSITNHNGDCRYPRTIIDHSGIIHICYQREHEKQFELIYQQKIPDKNIWTKEFVIDSSVYPFDASSIVFSNGILIVYWVRNDVIFYSSSSDGGNTWSKKEKYNFTTGKYLMCFVYKTNNQFERDKIVAYHLPGNFINGYKLAFFDQSSYNMGRLSADEFKDMIVEGLNLLKNNVSELREADSALRNDMLYLKVEYQEVQRELARCSVKLEVLKKELEEMRKGKEQKNTDLGIDVSREKDIGKFTNVRCKSVNRKKYFKKTKL